MCRLLISLLTGLMLALPAHADALDDSARRIAGSVATEQNISLIFGLLRRSLLAAQDGRPPPQLSAEEAARLEASGRELQRQAFAAATRALDEAEREARQTLREPPAPGRSN